MKNKARNADTGTGEAKPIQKTEFARKLYNLMLAKGWRQSELARRAGLPRDSISTYIRGKTLPTSSSAVKLAKALGVPPDELLPFTAESNPALRGGAAEVPSLAINVNPNNPDVAFLQINQNVPTSLALKIIEMVNSERAQSSK